MPSGVFSRPRFYEVTYVQNFTDIDDKMINRAAELGISVPELADRFIAAYFEDADALGVRRPTHSPRATMFIPEIIDLVSGLSRMPRLRRGRRCLFRC
jgi:cysteinyl-tRNA synthetase